MNKISRGNGFVPEWIVSMQTGKKVLCYYELIRQVNLIVREVSSARPVIYQGIVSACDQVSTLYCNVTLRLTQICRILVQFSISPATFTVHMKAS